MNGKDPAFKTEKGSILLDKGLSKEELTDQWKNHSKLPVLKKIIPIDGHSFRVMGEGGIGIYTISTGTVEYEKHTKRPFVYWINKLHYNQIKGWSPIADIFAASLLFFAVSGILIVRGKKGIAGRGLWYLLAGLSIPVIYIFLI